MTQRRARILFWFLVACIAGMAVLLAYGRQRGRERIESLADQTPLDAPTASTEPVTLDLANDSDGTIAAQERQIALPSEETARVRAIIDHLIAEYVLPGSPHPLPSGAAVNEVFLLPLPVIGYTVANTPDATADSNATETVPVAPPNGDALQPNTPGGELAVIDLRGGFVDQHPSGVEVETLTLLSIIGTLHANVPEIEQVRFLVDGQQRETLAGHADLLRTYPSRDTTLPSDTGGVR